MPRVIIATIAVHMIATNRILVGRLIVVDSLA
jgi:hypothetical protein